MIILASYKMYAVLNHTISHHLIFNHAQKGY